MDFQDRNILSLENDDNYTKNILKSPIGLAQELIKYLFNKSYDDIKNKIDDIKGFSAGIDRAKELGNEYNLAKFYPYLFSFHQFFHSSYRARQGKSLEAVVSSTINNLGDKITVAANVMGKKELISRALKDYDSNLDLDVVAAIGNKVLVIQLRSRDNTGGTTAKGSLVDALKNMFSYKTIEESDLFYIVGIWDILDGQQKNSTISKMYSALKDIKNIQLPSEVDFYNQIREGILIKDSILFSLSYGKDDLALAINSWLGQQYTFDIQLFKDKITSIRNWDDLWLAYTVSSIELENYKLYNTDNIEYLNILLSDESFVTNTITNSIDAVNLANELTLKIAPKWKKDIKIASTVAEKLCYIRDLILLRFINDKIS